MKAETDQDRSLSSSSVELESHGAELERDRFKERLRAIIPKRGENALASRAGISPSGLRGALKNGNPGREMLVAIARATGVHVEWLATGEGPRDRSSTEGADFMGVEDRQEQRPKPKQTGDKSLRYQAGFDRSTSSSLPEDIRRLAACLAATQRLQEGLDAEHQLLLAYRLLAAIDCLVQQGADQGRIEQEDIDALARLLTKLAKT